MFGAISFWLGRAALPLAPGPRRGGSRQHNPGLCQHPRPQRPGGGSHASPPHRSPPVSRPLPSWPTDCPRIGVAWRGARAHPSAAPARATESQKQLSPLCPAALGFRYPRSRSRPRLAPHAPHPCPPPCAGREPRVPLQPLLGLGQFLGHTGRRGVSGWGLTGAQPRCSAAALGWGLFCFLCPQQLKIAASFLGEYGEHDCLATGWMWSPAPGWWCRLCDTAKLPAHAGSPWPPQHPSVCRGGQDPTPGERWLWNDTITPAERAAREPSGMSCLSKALSAPLRALPRPLRFQGPRGRPAGML